MKRVAFLIEEPPQLIHCLLNPEDTKGSFTIQRSSGAVREEQNSLSRTTLTDNPVVFRSRGDTSLNLNLLFDVDLLGSNSYIIDVRELTQPIWELAEYATSSDKSKDLPHVRFIWGQAWNIPVTVESVSESFERFTTGGIPQRSWMSLRLLRRTDETPPANPPSNYIPGDIPEYDPEFLQPPGSSSMGGPGWGVCEVLGGDTGGQPLWKIAVEKYGDASLWRLIARANQIDDISRIPAGTILHIPPLDILRIRK